LILLQEYITMHGHLNVKFKHVYTVGVPKRWKKTIHDAVYCVWETNDCLVSVISMRQ